MSIPTCRIEPLGDFQFSFKIFDTEVTRWCFSPLVPRPYFFPVNGPSGRSLTRMGHPGAPNHDHHRSFWFAHNDLMGQDFWSENKAPRIVQSQWYAIEDRDDLARLALELHWKDGHDPQPLARQDLFLTLRPMQHTAAAANSAPGEWTLELQSDFRAGGQGVAFRKNNFGILGLRVAKSLSVVFGSGTITGSQGQTGEKALFGMANRWLDYSGPITDSARTTNASSTASDSVIEGVALIDHRHNPAHPAKWHVRDDGWLGPSLSRDAEVPLHPQNAMTARYLLVVHRGGADAAKLNMLADEFDKLPPLRVIKGTKPHHQWELQTAP
ncbi:MAG: PmoA family protein [Pirellulaceae bacterium]|nr:PmoA family protein [Pirellulaceae bacterium]